MIRKNDHVCATAVCNSRSRSHEGFDLPTSATQLVSFVCFQPLLFTLIAVQSLLSLQVSADASLLPCLLPLFCQYLMSAMAPKTLYRTLIREAKKMHDYNFRSYALRRVKVGFEKNRELQGYVCSVL